MLLLFRRVSFWLNKHPLFSNHVVDDIHVLLDRNNQSIPPDHEDVLQERKINLKRKRTSETYRLEHVFHLYVRSQLISRSDLRSHEVCVVIGEVVLL